MNIIKRLTMMVVVAVAAMGIVATTASAGLHEGPFHGVQEFGVFQGGAGGLSCEGHFEGEVTSGAWDPAEGTITSLEFNQCTPTCDVDVTTPIHVNFYEDGGVELEDAHVAVGCFGASFASGDVVGTMDCAGHLVFENQPFVLEGTSIVAASWTSEWHVSGIENEKCA